MSDLKTRPTSASVRDYISAIDDQSKRRDARELARELRRITGWRARLWGSSIVGFGRYHYRYASGREGDWMVTGFAPRKRDLVVYIMPGFSAFSALLKQLGRHRKGKSCLYLRGLDDIDREVLWELVARSVDDMRSRYAVKG